MESAACNKEANLARVESFVRQGRAWLMRWLPSRAHDNGVFMVFANGVGVEPGAILMS